MGHDPRATPPRPADEILEHYTRYPEDDRLKAGDGRLEFVRSCELIHRHLPEPPARVADVGGGAGVYATWLASAGYEVHLSDPVPRHVDRAGRAAGEAGVTLASATIGDARRLEHDTDSLDAVLMLGPLYHLTERGQRLRALREARRALAPGGVLIGAAISRFASTLDGMTRDLTADPAFVDIAARDLLDGQHRNPTADPRYFTTAFFHHPDELRAETSAAGFRVDALLAVEGPAWMLGDLAARWEDAEARERVLDAIRAIEAEPSTLGASAHLLVLATNAEGED